MEDERPSFLAEMVSRRLHGGTEALTELANELVSRNRARECQLDLWIDLGGEVSMLTVQDIAAVCHDANRRFCIGLGDYTQRAWTVAEKWQRESAVAGVEWRLKNLEAPPSAQHDAWLADKVAAGWKYGPVKDAGKLEHPCLVPYAELPEHQKAKDHLFVAIVLALAPLLALEAGRK